MTLRFLTSTLTLGLAFTFAGCDLGTEVLGDPNDSSGGSAGSMDDGGDDGDPSEGYDPCEGRVCGDTCTVCAPDDPDCVETAVLKACNAGGECVAETPDLCTDPAPEYDPCEGLACGEQCFSCDPNDPDCFETTVVKLCDEEGRCMAGEPPECTDPEPPTYDPCEGRACGESCTVCDPANPDCSETGVLKACDPEGQCVAETPDLCGGDYDPCAGLTCGDPCTACDPNDPDCIETAVPKFCNAEGTCLGVDPGPC